MWLVVNGGCIAEIAPSNSMCLTFRHVCSFAALFESTAWSIAKADMLQTEALSHPEVPVKVEFSHIRSRMVLFPGVYVCMPLAAFGGFKLLL